MLCSLPNFPVNMNSFACIPCTYVSETQYHAPAKNPVASQHSIPCPDGRFVATLPIIQSFLLSRDITSTWHFFQWFGRSGARTDIPDQTQTNSNSPAISSRLLLANGDTIIIMIWDIGDSQWSAVINGATSNLGEVARVCFGFTHNGILVFSRFRIKVTIWSLATSRGFEFKRSKVFTNITTVDAHGFKWSPDARWLFVWDAARMGYVGLDLHRGRISLQNLFWHPKCR